MLLALVVSQAAIAGQNGNQLPYRQCFDATAKTYNLDSDWLTAIAIVSSLNPRAVSSANAVGLMQIRQPQTAAHLGAKSRASLFDPCTNVDLGGRYLRELTDRYKGDMQRALAAYRIGPTAWHEQVPGEVVLEYRRRINEQLDILRQRRQALGCQDSSKKGRAGQAGSGQTRTRRDCNNRQAGKNTNTGSESSDDQPPRNCCISTSHRTLRPARAPARITKHHPAKRDMATD